MNIGFDLHGVLNEFPLLFKPLMGTLYKKHTIFIVSGPPTDQIEIELKKLDFFKYIHFDHIISVVDFIKKSGVKMWQDDRDRWWTDEKLWWQTKAKICKKYDIKILYDDKIEYKESMDVKDTLFLHV